MISQSVKRKAQSLKLSLIALCALHFALTAPLALAACTSDSCASGQRCAVDSRIPGGSACFPGCSLSSSGEITCNVGTDCISVGGQAVCVSPDSPLVTGGAPINPRCEGSRTCPTDRRYECVSGECRIPLGQACEASSQCLSTLSCINAPSGGKACLISPVPPGGAASSSETPFTSITPQLGVEIPGLTLSPAVKVGESVSVPFLAQYVNAAYRYMVTIVLIVSIVMVVYGGFRYLVGASMGDIKAGKKIIMDALGGMLIVLGAYMILNTINPNTLDMKVLSLEFVQFEELEEIPVADYIAATGSVPPSSQENINLAREVAVTMGIDPCEAEAVVRGESGGKANTIGYDANVPRVGVGSRRAFIKSEETYTKKKFEAYTGEWPTVAGKRCSATQNVTEEQLRAIQDRSLRNDDRFDPTAPPNFGLDPRFTVGIGTFQVTPLIDQRTCEMGRCPNGYIGRTVGGTCYSVPELLEPRTQTIAGLSIYKSGRDSSQCASQRDEYTRLRCAFSRIAGTGDSARVSSCRKMTYYAACKGISHHERANCRSWLNTPDAIADDFTSE